MISDKNGHPVACLTITTALRDEMISTIRMRIIHNLEAIKEFLRIQGYEDVCAALYTYAFEEYGKIRFLNRCPTLPNNKIKVRYTNDNHGFLDHDHKFNLVFEDKALPDCCKVLRKGDYNKEDYVGNDYVVDTPADMEARMSVFYTDFDKNNKYSSILKPLEFDRDLLIKAVDKFLEFIMAQNYP